MCSPRNTGNLDFSLWLTGGLSQGCPDIQKVYVFKVYVPFLVLELMKDKCTLDDLVHLMFAIMVVRPSMPNFTPLVTHRDMR